MRKYIIAAMLIMAAKETTAATVTAYCACRLCCGKGAKGITASGKPPVQGRTVAASRRIPLGTRIFIEGVGWRVVEDRLSRRYDGRVDVFFSQHADAVKFGKRKLAVTFPLLPKKLSN